jgi:hypothetical protein
MLESYKKYPFKGFNLTFHPERCDLAEYVWLEIGDEKEWVKKKINKSSSPSPTTAPDLSTMS